MTAPASEAAPARTRAPARIGILSQGTSQFDSRAQRIARSCVAAGDTVTIYSRFRRGLPREESLDGYRIVRLPLSASDARAAMEEAAAEAEGARQAEGSRPGKRKGGKKGTAERAAAQVPAAALSRDPLSRATRAARATSRRLWKRSRTAARTGMDRVEAELDTVPVISPFPAVPVASDAPRALVRTSGGAPRHLARHVGRVAAGVVPGPAALRWADRLRRP